MCKLIKKDKKIDYELKRDISFILQILIFKYFKNAKTRENLLRMINMNRFKSALEIIAYELYGDELEEKNEIIDQKDEELQQCKEVLTEIKEKNNLDKESLEKINAILK